MTVDLIESMDLILEEDGRAYIELTGDFVRTCAQYSGAWVAEGDNASMKMKLRIGTHELAAFAGELVDNGVIETY